jgi:ATP-dependent DNA helicase RecQ
MTLDLHAGLKALGYAEFRPGQQRAIETLLSRERLLYVAPTGGGKSLVYQLPAVLLPGTTLVVSPLIALMQDQVSALGARGVAATFLASTLDGDEMERRLRAAARGEYRLLYVAPERLTSAGFRRVLPSLQCPLVAVDEAHCISEWGHDFRPEYMQLGGLLAALRGARVLACTATATPVVRDEIVTRLALGADTPQIVHGFARPNLVLRAAEVVSARDRDARVDALLEEALGGPREQRGSAIVYAPTRAGAEEESVRLGRKGWHADYYHAGRAGSDREDVQRRFLDRSLDVIVATNAFGMGIDRADVRAVVHLGPPSSIEAYYQEVGRAGRDGERAYGLLLTSSTDMPLRRRLIESGGDGERVEPAIVEHKWNLFLELMRWAEGGSCRHDAILRYFDDQDEALGGCGQCDICTSIESNSETASAEETQLVVRKALSGVARVHGRFGLHAAVKLLKGQPDPRLLRAGLDAVRTFGALSAETDEWITQLLRRLVTAGLVVFSGDDRPVVMLTEQGRAVMEGRNPARVLLPSRVARARVKRRGRGGMVVTRVEVPSLVPGGERTVERSPEAEALLDDDALALFEALRAYRRTVSRAQDVPPYVVASDRSLRDIARLRPGTRDELLSAHGMGPVKVDRFGEGLLAVVAGRPPTDLEPVL